MDLKSGIANTQKYFDLLVIEKKFRIYIIVHESLEVNAFIILE